MCTTKPTPKGTQHRGGYNYIYVTLRSTQGIRYSTDSSQPTDCMQVYNCK